MSEVKDINLNIPARGATGPQGPAGPKGDKGDIGPQGPVGQQGPQGVAGKDGHSVWKNRTNFAPNREFNYFTDLVNASASNPPKVNDIMINADGNMAMITKVDITNDSGSGGGTFDYGPWVGNIKGPTGPQGPKGDKGDTGATGPQGPQGGKGDKGDQGVQGPKGDKGDPGPQGPKGDTGSQGPKGATGPQGQQGPSPIRGVDYWTPSDQEIIKEWISNDIINKAW